MKFKKKLLTLLSFLMMSVFLLTGCSPEAEDLAADVLTGIIEAELEDETELPVVEEDVVTETPEQETVPEEVPEDETNEDFIDENGTYTSKEEVAAYLHEYGHLPSNFITKKEARNLGWVSSEGNLWEVADGMSIGGDIFGNREGLLPEDDARVYYECDVNYEGGFRGSERVVFSDDGLIYYTGDHYESFELLYDGWYEGELDMGPYADAYWAQYEEDAA